MDRCVVLCALAGAALINPAFADKAETKGGLKITSDDGNYSAALDGRIHFDTYLFDPDIEDPVSTTEFRRVRIALTGKAYSWRYKLQQDFTSDASRAGFREIYIAHDFYGGAITIGQFSPYRAMADLTSSNEITMMERPFTSATGFFDGRLFQQGIGWHNHWDCYTLGIMAFNLRDGGGPRNEGVGSASRLTWAPINDDISTLHFGISYSYENTNRNSAPLQATADYAGRRGPTQLIAFTPGDRDVFFGNFGDPDFFIGEHGGAVSATGLELAGTYSPLYAQAEYVRGEYDGGYFMSESIFEDFFGGPPTFACDPLFGCFIGDQDVQAWYVMGSWTVTGEHKPYNGDKGVFKSIKPRSGWGAWELTALYGLIENKDIPDLKAESVILGVNYYHKARVRFMFNVVLGDDEFTGDKTKQLAIRAQMYW